MFWSSCGKRTAFSRCYDSAGGPVERRTSVSPPSVAASAAAPREGRDDRHAGHNSPVWSFRIAHDNPSWSYTQIQALLTGCSFLRDDKRQQQTYVRSGSRRSRSQGDQEHRNFTLGQTLEEWLTLCASCQTPALGNPRSTVCGATPLARCSKYFSSAVNAGVLGSGPVYFAN
jgi:hypothetical protein